MGLFKRWRRWKEQKEVDQEKKRGKWREERNKYEEQKAMLYRKLEAAERARIAFQDTHQDIISEFLRLEDMVESIIEEIRNLKGPRFRDFPVKE